jgi:hypothetical protein
MNKDRHKPILNENGLTPRESAAVDPLEIAHQLDMMEQTLHEHLDRIANSLEEISYWTRVSNFDKEPDYVHHYQKKYTRER